MEHDIFISHSAHDKAVADAVCAALENAGIRCWIAPRDVQPGRPFPGEITRAIEQSKAIVLIFSAHSNNSEHVLREVQLAAHSRLHIIQFRIDSVVANDDLEFFLSGPHWLDALTPPLQRHLETLQCSIKALLSLPGDAPPKVPPVGSEASSDVWKWIGAAAAVTMLGYFAYVSFSSHSRPSPAPAVAQSSPAASASATASPSITREPTQVADSPAPKASVALLVNQAEAESFIRSFYRDMEHDDADKVLAYFDETVDYLAYGRKEKAFIAGQLPQYFAAFPNRSFSVGEVRLQTSSTSGSVPVTFEARYSLRSLGQTTASTGRSHVEWDLVKRDGALKIIRFTHTSYPNAFPSDSP